MKHLALFAAGASALAFGAVPANATLINFDDLAIGTTLSNQYAALGVLFSPNAFSGAGGPTGDWATNSDMTIVSSTGSDVGGLGNPSLVSGNLLRSFSGWLNEDGDASFTITFTTAVSAFSLDFAGIATPSSTTISLFNGTTLLSTLTAGSGGQVRLSGAAASITSLKVTPGDFFDWVGVDNLDFTPVATTAVPEPASWAMMLMGFALTGAMMRRRQTTRVRFA